jgi:hypothetical protein
MLTLTHIKEYTDSGCTTIIDSDEMASVGKRMMNIIGDFINYNHNYNDTDMELKDKSPEAWAEIRTSIGFSGYVPLHFHPYLLRYAILSPINYFNTAKLVGCRNLNTMLEGCMVRVRGVEKMAMVVEQSFRVPNHQCRSMFVCSVNSDVVSNGGPQFLTYFALYTNLIIAFFADNGVEPFHSNLGFFHKVLSDQDIHNINTFILMYTTIFYMTDEQRDTDATSTRTHSCKSYKHYNTKAHNIYHTQKILVPLVIRKIEWKCPPIKEGSWMMWNTKTPVRWKKNLTDQPFIAVNTSLFNMPNGQLNPSTERNRLKEFANARVNQRRVHTTIDKGQEAQWVKKELKNKFNHPVAVDGDYCTPCLGLIRSRILGVCPQSGMPARWNEGL